MGPRARKRSRREAHNFIAARRAAGEATSAGVPTCSAPETRLPNIVKVVFQLRSHPRGEGVG